MSMVMTMTTAKHGYRTAVVEESLVPGAPGSLLETLCTLYDTPSRARQYIGNCLESDASSLDQALRYGILKGCDKAYVFHLGVWEVHTIEDGKLGDSTAASAIVDARRRGKQKDSVHKWISSGKSGTNGVAL